MVIEIIESATPARYCPNYTKFYTNKKSVP